MILKKKSNMNLEKMNNMEICGDNRFEIIKRAKEHLIKGTNIETSQKEMEVLDNFLFRCWQMGWLDMYDIKKEDTINTNIEIVDRKNSKRYNRRCMFDSNITSEQLRTLLYTNVDEIIKTYKGQ